MINSNCIDALSHLDVMLAQESTLKFFKYFKNTNACGINKAWRNAMITWIQQVQKTLLLSPDTVWIAMSYFDRYLCSGKGKSTHVLKDKLEFQLAAVTAFYTAVKIHEPVVLGVDVLVMLCRGIHTEEDIINMEYDILTALEWRVSCPTGMDFARSICELIREDDNLPSYIADSILGSCEQHMDNAVADINFWCCRPSVLGISCVVSALAASDVLTLEESQAIWVRLSTLCNFDLSSVDIAAAQQYLMSQSSQCESDIISQVAKQQQPVPNTSADMSYNVEVGSLSPISVVQSARTA
ncbi:hypothetical protein ACHAWU_003852 [Discostella pseudostelligera]|uniref:Cyclin-like domain-containing protein n=1 Tax=Discostella pseudostelligera TaxID=259834 RepID=A0ABD3MFH8_9STRA